MNMKSILKYNIYARKDGRTKRCVAFVHVDGYVLAMAHGLTITEAIRAAARKAGALGMVPDDGGRWMV